MTIQQRFDALYTKEANGCWIWTGAKHSARFPYGKFRMNRKSFNAHRVSWLLHKGDIPDGLQVLHKCDVYPCVNPDHLFLGTQLDNMQDAVVKGRHRNSVFHGEQHPMAKLTNEQAARIRLDRRSLKEIALEYGVTRSTVSDIRLGKIWKTGKDQTIITIESMED